MIGKVVIWLSVNGEHEGVIKEMKESGNAIVGCFNDVGEETGKCVLIAKNNFKFKNGGEYDI